MTSRFHPSFESLLHSRSGVLDSVFALGGLVLGFGIQGVEG